MLLFPAFLLSFTVLGTLAKDLDPCTTYDTDGTFYDLSPLAAKKDYSFKSFSGREFYINVCESVRTETWRLDDPDRIGGFLREERGDFSIGQVNTTVEIRDGHPLLILTGGSTCFGGVDIKASTAIRFICDRSVFSAGEPKLIAELPPQDENACAFFVEWRTHVACPASKPGSVWGVITVVIMSIIGGFLVYLILRVAYNRFVLKEQGFGQIPSLPFSSSFSLGGVFEFFHDTCDRMGFTRDRWANEHNWRGFSSGGGSNAFERLPSSHEEAQSMLGNGGDARYSIEDEDEDREMDAPKPPPGMDSDGVIRL